MLDFLLYLAMWSGLGILLGCVGYFAAAYIQGESELPFEEETCA